MTLFIIMQNKTLLHWKKPNKLGVQVYFYEPSKSILNISLFSFNKLPKSLAKSQNKNKI